MRKALSILALAALLSGCLEKESTQTLYLETDGSVTWEVLERNVYSTADTEADRAREEREYLEAALAGRPSVLDALGELGGTDLQATVLRDTPPYSVRATGRFKDLPSLLTALFAAAEAPAEVTLQADGAQRVLTIFRLEDGPRSAGADSEALLDLFASDDMRFVLSAGTFTESEGFTIGGGGRQAIWPTGEAGGERERLTLSWTLPDDRD